MGGNFTSLTVFGFFYDFDCQDHTEQFIKGRSNVPSLFFGENLQIKLFVFEFLSHHRLYRQKQVSLSEPPVGTYLLTFKTKLTSPTLIITLYASVVKAHLSVEK